MFQRIQQYNLEEAAKLLVGGVRKLSKKVKIPSLKDINFNIKAYNY